MFSDHSKDSLYWEYIGEAATQLQPQAHVIQLRPGWLSARVVVKQGGCWKNEESSTWRAEMFTCMSQATNTRSPMCCSEERSALLGSDHDLASTSHHGTEWAMQTVGTDQEGQVSMEGVLHTDSNTSDRSRGQRQEQRGMPRRGTGKEAQDQETVLCGN